MFSTIVDIEVGGVEDEALLAIDVAKQLVDAGLEVIGPAYKVSLLCVRPLHAWTDRNPMDPQP